MTMMASARYAAFVLFLLAAAIPAAAQDHDVSATIAGTVHVTLNARVAIDVQSTPDAADSSDDTSALDVARRRVGVSGSVGKRLDFEVEQEIGSAKPWRDAYADFRVHRAVRVRAGQFKLPFSLDETTGASHLDFVSRSRAATQLAPGRDIGLMVHGHIWNKRLEYETGIFRHDGSGPSMRHPDRTYGTGAAAIRLSARPFAASKRSVGDLRLAVSLADAGLSEGVSNLRGRTISNETFFPAAYWVSGRRHRTGLEARWRPGPFSFTAEYMRAVDDRRAQGVLGEDLSPLVAAGWYVATVWRVPRTIVPWRPLRIETTARVEGLEFRSANQQGLMSTNPRSDRIAGGAERAVTLGVNWSITSHVKVLVNAVHERVRRDDVSSTSSSWTRVVSLQFGL